jgi:hypothetical protein
MKNKRKSNPHIKIGVLSLLSMAGLGAIESKILPKPNSSFEFVLFSLNLIIVYFLLIKPLFDQKAKIVPLRRKNGF